MATGAGTGTWAETLPPLTEAVAELFPRKGQWTEHDYWPFAEQNRVIELSDGELIAPPMPTTEHQDIVGNIYVALRAYVRVRRLGRVGIAPLPVRLWEGKVREPDVMVMLNEHLERVTSQHWGPPDLVVEVLSPGTTETDRTQKPREYALAGVPEYWIVAPATRSVEVYRLEEQAYALEATCREPGVVVSRVVGGLVVPVADIFGEGESETASGEE
ncbi:MAG: Uma2 family endonuclease [Chloroflexaceae bacterium]|nr:Uma2 family endonuclease [Chloroflexaceae bacterium]